MFFFQLEELQQDLETQTELAASRLQELQEMHEKNKNLMGELESLRLNVIAIFLLLFQCQLNSQSML